MTSCTKSPWTPCLPPSPWLTSAGRRRDPQTWRLRQVTNQLCLICYSFPQEPVSILSGELAGSKDSFEEDRSVTCMDIKLIMPTVCILLFTVFVMVTVIPYAFSAVIKQLQGVWALEDQSKIANLFPFIAIVIIFRGRSCSSSSPSFYRSRKCYKSSCWGDYWRDNSLLMLMLYSF